MIEGTRTPNEATPPVKIHSIFRWGTNLAKYMVAQQFDCTPSSHLGGHKHLPLPCIPGTTEQAWTRTAFCVKNPLGSLISLFRYAQTVKFKHFVCGRSWDAFLHGRLLIRMNGNRLWPAYRFADPVDYWNALYANVFSVPMEHLFVLNYEELLRDPVPVMKRMAQHFPQLRPTGATFTLPANKPSRGADSQVHAMPEDRAFDDAQLRYVEQRVDLDVLAAGGYAPGDLRCRIDGATAVSAGCALGSAEDRPSCSRSVQSLRGRCR